MIFINIFFSVAIFYTLAISIIKFLPAFGLCKNFKMNRECKSIGEDVSKKDALACLEALFETVKELLNFLGAIKYKGQFDKTIYESTQNILVTADQAKSVEVENVNDLAK